MATTTQEIDDFLRKSVKPRLLQNPQLKSVIVWTISLDSQTGKTKLGMAIGGAGCSPFCGCAAQQLADMIAIELGKRFPDITKVIGEAALPSQQIQDEWNKA